MALAVAHGGHIALLDLFFGGLVFAIIGGVLYLLERGFPAKRPMRHGQWKHTISTLSPADVGWIVAKPFLFGGLLSLAVGLVGLILTSRF